MGSVPRPDVKAQILIQKARVRALKMKIAQGIFREVPPDQLKEPERLLKLEIAALKKLREKL